MMTIRRSEERGRARFDWLDSRHSFSFGSYYDPAHMGFGSLRVINEDRVARGGGFATHGHADMEIISYVLAGALEHKDSLGTGTVIRPGEVQRMTAGTGITHSEFNPSRTDPVHFLQIWILPARKGLTPGYEQRAYSEADRRDRLRLVASQDGREGSVTVHQDAALYAALLAPGGEVEHRFADGRRGWIQVARGSIEANGTALSAGDGAAIAKAPAVVVRGREPAEFLLFDLA
jgi:redox-sensitive bicupin YhaK (pirin superfamily)